MIYNKTDKLCYMLLNNKLTMDTTEFVDTIDNTEVMALRLAIVGLAAEAGFKFCHGCNTFGKISEYYATVCYRCGEWTCDDCSGICNRDNMNRVIENYNNNDKYQIIFEYCTPCNNEIDTKRKVDIMTIIDRETSKPLNWDKFNIIFNKDLTVDYMLDVINDYFESGINYKYNINLLNLYRSNLNECCIGIYFDLKNEYKDEPDDVQLDELVKELSSYIYSEIDGFNFTSGSEYVKTDITFGVDLDLSI